jgi:glycosyltransferase involved in cell wall biosynthesis
LWDEAKGIDTLVHAAPSLPWPVYLAGEQANGTSSLGSNSNCRMLGQLSAEQLAGYYARAAIYVLPARYEPFGFSALEAAMSGCALVLGNIGSLREIWGEAATFVVPDDPATLAGDLRELMADPELRNEMARRSSLHACEFTADRMASAYLAAYGRARKESYACA